MHREVPRWNCPTRQEFRTVESISSDFNITKHQSTLRIVTSTVPYIDEVMRSFYNSGTGIPPRSPLERFKRRCTGHVTARRCCASGCSLQFPGAIDAPQALDADPSRVCRGPVLLSATTHHGLSFHRLRQQPPERCVAPALHPEHAQRTVQSGACALRIPFRPPSRVRRVFAGGLQARAEREAASEVVAGVFSR